MSKSENTFVMHPSARLEMGTKFLVERIERYAKKVSEGQESPHFTAIELKAIAECVEELSAYAVTNLKKQK